MTGTIEKLPETVGNQKVIATCRYENKEGQKHLLADANVSAIALIYENETAALPNIHAMKAALETDSVKFNLFRSSLPVFLIQVKRRWPDPCDRTGFQNS